MNVLRGIAIATGVLLIVIGVPFMISPFPFGFIPIAIGASIILASSPRARAWLRLTRHRHESVDKTVGAAEEKTPHKVSRPLKRTRPH